MPIVVTVLRLSLGAVFLLSSFGKLADLPGTRRAIADFGLPARLASPLALVLLLGELAAIVLLLEPGTAAWGAVLVLFLLAIFSMAIALNLARGRHPNCHCFGQSTPSRLARHHCSATQGSQP